MKSKDYFLGLLLVGLGIIFLLRNLNIFWFDWCHLKSLWPVIIIIVGIAFLPIHNALRIFLALIVVSLSIFWISSKEPRDRSISGSKDSYWWKRDKDDDNDEKCKWSKQILSEGYGSDISHAVLELDAIAGKYKIETTNEFLLKLEKEGNLGDYTLNTEAAGNSKILRLKMKDRKTRTFNCTNNSKIFLNPMPIWDLNIDAGATSIDFDLEAFKIDKIDIDGGAASISLKLGDLNDKTDVRINAGAASITIEVPETSGCEIFTSTVISSKNFEGFEKESSGHYLTSNFDASEKKITLRIDAAVSGLKVERY